jgi:uncharacterized protein YjbJ (UPF0337 family)
VTDIKVHLTETARKIMPIGLEKTTGNIKEKAGEALGDRHLKSEGRAEKTEGHIRSGLGKAMAETSAAPVAEHERQVGKHLPAVWLPCSDA